MSKTNVIPYIDYTKLDREFYPLEQVCKLLGVSKATVKEGCEKFDVRIQKNEIGDWGFSTYDFRKLHNQLYYENRDKAASAAEDDPWN